MGGSKLNEIIVQFATFKNDIPLSSPTAYELFPNSVTSGANPNTPQKTEQTKWQFRDDFSWSVTGMGGLGHDFKTGVNFINEPHLFATFNSGVDDYFYTHLTDERSGPIQTITRNGGVGDVNIPFRQVLHVRAGRLARVRPVHAEPGTAVRPGHGRADRSVEEPELPGAAGGRTRRPVPGRLRARGFREGPA